MAFNAHVSQSLTTKPQLGRPTGQQDLFGAVSSKKKHHRNQEVKTSRTAEDLLTPKESKADKRKKAVDDSFIRYSDPVVPVAPSFQYESVASDAKRSSFEASITFDPKTMLAKEPESAVSAILKDLEDSGLIAIITRENKQFVRVTALDIDAESIAKLIKESVEKYLNEEALVKGEKLLTKKPLNDFVDSLSEDIVASLSNHSVSKRTSKTAYASQITNRFNE